MSQATRQRNAEGWLLTCIALCAIFSILFAGCTQDGEEATGTDKSAKAKAGATEPTAQMLAVLAKADAVDGKADKVVSKCVTCSLGMAGKAEHTCTVGEYKLHVCSEHCKEMFDSDPAKALGSLKIP